MMSGSPFKMIITIRPHKESPRAIGSVGTKVVPHIICVTFDTSAATSSGDGMTVIARSFLALGRRLLRHIDRENARWRGRGPGDVRRVRFAGHAARAAVSDSFE